MEGLLGFLFLAPILGGSSSRRDTQKEYHPQDCYKDEPSDLYDRNDELYLKQKQEQDMRNNKQ